MPTQFVYGFKGTRRQVWTYMVGGTYPKIDGGRTQAIELIRFWPTLELARKKAREYAASVSSPTYLLHKITIQVYREVREEL